MRALLAQDAGPGRGGGPETPAFQDVGIAEAMRDLHNLLVSPTIVHNYGQGSPVAKRLTQYRIMGA